MTEKNSPPRRKRKPGGKPGKKRTGNRPPESKLKFGKLRERVKSGKLCPKRVLRWLRTQPYQSESLVRWLQGFNLDEHRARAEADRSRAEEASKK